MYNPDLAMKLSLACILASLLPTAAFVYAILRQTKGRFKNNTEFICFLLVLGQFLFCLAVGVASIAAIKNPLGFGDPGLCLFQATSIMAGTGGLFSLHALLALERLRVLLTGRPMTPLMMFVVFSGYFLGWIVTFIVQFWAQTPLQLWGTGIVCYLVLYSSNPNDRIGWFLLIAHCMIWVVTMCIAYGYVLFVVRKAIVGNTGLNSSKSVALQKKQLFRCLLIFLVTACCYVPNILCMLFEAFLNAPVPDYLQDFALEIETLDGLFTVIVLLYVNAKNWNAFKKYILWMSVDPSITKLASRGSSKQPNEGSS